MTPKQFEDLYAMISANVNNTSLIGEDLKKKYDKTVNIENNIALVMKNQSLILNELQNIKKLIINK